MKSKYHYLLTFLATLSCFIWLAVTNQDTPRGRHGGSIVTYELPAYILLIIIGQFFFFIPWHCKKDTKIHLPVLNKKIKIEESPKLYKIIFYIPSYIGGSMILYSMIKIL